MSFLAMPAFGLLVRQTTLIQTERSHQRCIAMKLCSDIHGPQEIIPTDYIAVPFSLMFQWPIIPKP